MATDEKVLELRNMFLNKLDKEGHLLPDGVHPEDMEKIKHDDSLLRPFLIQYDNDVNVCCNSLWSTVEWRQKNKVYEITEETIRMDYIKEAIFFSRNHDLDGKNLLIFLSKNYVKSRNMDDVKRCLIYYVERMRRENNNDKLTIFFDMTDAGLSNMDMEFTKYIITIFKLYYPDAINYIIVYNMPWMLSATFKIIKQLLPAKAANIMKFVSPKTLKEYVDEDNQLKIWGGKDDYTFEFVSETPSPSLNSSKKVHFANMSPNESPITETSPSFQDKGDGEMLRIEPQDTISFIKYLNEFHGSAEISNISQKSITYKIKTTAPEKFRVRPSTGILTAGASAKITVVLQHGHHISTMNRDKFLVMCMEIQDSNQGDLAELWKNTSGSNLAVEQHRLKCTFPPPLTGDGQKNGNIYSSGTDSDRQMIHVTTSISQLTETTHRLESQIKFNQTLQWITLIVFLLLSVAVVYILKIEIRTNSSQHCLLRDD